ncbi:MAG: XdhC family protein [Chitinophagaceae bacterium]
MRNIATWKLISDSLGKGIAVMLLYVLESKGSSPGRQGFFMAVNETGDMEGSIGGGIMEHKFAEMAKKRLKGQGGKEQEIRKQHHDKEAAANQSGMICSGEQTILLYQLIQTDSVVVKNIIDSLEQNKNGTLNLSPSGIAFSSTVPENDFFFEMRFEEDWIYIEKTGYKNQLFIVGGGHCALALSKLMRLMGFYIHVYDDRKELKTMRENKDAQEKHFINDYSELKELIPSGANHYVIIMTFGYRTDDEAIRALIEKNFRFLGVLGSKSKIKKMMTGYRNEEMKEEFLERIHAPAGLFIKSETPEEIAVSIAAAMIAIKNKNN